MAYDTRAARPRPVLRIPASLDALEDLAVLVRDLSDRAGLRGDVRYRLRLAVDELATNVVMHGYRDGGGELRADGGVEPDRVWVRLEDDAPAFDPRDGMTIPAVGVPLADRRVGGLGVYLALTAVDHFTYERTAGSNVSVLTMRRTADAQR